MMLKDTNEAKKVITMKKFVDLSGDEFYLAENNDTALNYYWQII